MNWNLYNQASFGGRNQGNFRGGYNTQQGNSSGGGYGRGGGGNHYRGGYRQEHDLYVNDEVVGGGGGGSGGSPVGGYHRKAPPAHSGNNYSGGYGNPGPIFNPPQAHSYTNFPGYAHYGYGNFPQTWPSDYGYSTSSPTRRNNHSQRSNSDEERAEVGKPGVNPVQDRRSEKDSKPASRADKSTEEHHGGQHSADLGSGYSTQPTPETGSSTGTGTSNSRRKQYTPQKVPVGPGGGGTMNIITQKGLILDSESDQESSKLSQDGAKNLMEELNAADSENSKNLNEVDSKSSDEKDPKKLNDVESEDLQTNPKILTPEISQNNTLSRASKLSPKESNNLNIEVLNNSNLLNTANSNPVESNPLHTAESKNLDKSDSKKLDATESNNLNTLDTTNSAEVAKNSTIQDPSTGSSPSDESQKLKTTEVNLQASADDAPVVYESVNSENGRTAEISSIDSRRKKNSSTTSTQSPIKNVSEGSNESPANKKVRPSRADSKAEEKRSEEKEMKKSSIKPRITSSKAVTPLKTKESPMKSSPGGSKDSLTKSSPVATKHSPAKSGTNETKESPAEMACETMDAESTNIQESQNDNDDRDNWSGENPILPSLRNEDTPQRRRSKGEMKEFPAAESRRLRAGEGTKTKNTESTKKELQEIDKTEETESEPNKDEKTNSSPSKKSDRKKEGETPSPVKRDKEVFKKVEEDMEAMFAGLGSPEKEDKEEDNPPEVPQVEVERKSPRSKRKSAQTAELKIRENQSDEAFAHYRSQPRTKQVKENSAVSKEAKKSDSSKLKIKLEEPKPTSSVTEAKLEEVKSAGRRSSAVSRDDKPAATKTLANSPSKKKEIVKPILRIVDETAVSDQSQEMTEVVEVAEVAIPRRKQGETKEKVEDTTPQVAGRRSRRSRDMVPEVSNPATQEPTPTPENGRSKRKRTSSVKEYSEDTTTVGPVTTPLVPATPTQGPTTPTPGPTTSTPGPTTSIPGLTTPTRGGPTESANKRARRRSPTSQEITSSAAVTDGSSVSLSASKVALPGASAPPAPVRSSVRKRDPGANQSKEDPVEPVDEIIIIENIVTADVSSAKKKSKPSQPKSKAKEEKGKKNKKSQEELPETRGTGITGKKSNMKNRAEWKGPYVHIEGDFRSPRTVRVVNSEASEHKTRLKRGLHDSEHRSKSTSFGHNSTLSKQYDHKSVDESWRCVFCHQKSHHRGLGDLFGPYWVPPQTIKAEPPEKKSKSKRKSLNSESETAEKTDKEIWFHEECFCWIPGVYLLGSRLMGMEEAVSLCSETRCSACGETGASLGCTRAGCRTVVHVPCSLDQTWHTDLQTFSAACPACSEG